MSGLASGAYRVEVEVKDLVSQNTMTAAEDFRILEHVSEASRRAHVGTARRADKRTR